MYECSFIIPFNILFRNSNSTLTRNNAGLSFYFHKFLTGQVVTLNAFKRFYLSLFVTYVTLENCYTTMLRIT
ncbi:hypothetical protein C9F06_09475 [Salmonella enterica subsp. enterica serovar Wilhelmsburg]|uniref:Uncharacterized protein n=1 Tax=Salmonella enterica subsp. enterica serovar Wilhelmsburg TaxID=1960126 RepID=A0A659RT56_SALET|nr:hypothetical protein C9F06_09475 [Salmonella enterica subsp. enterica serovar Wilhelmsburg]